MSISGPRMIRPWVRSLNNCQQIIRGEVGCVGTLDDSSYDHVGGEGDWHLALPLHL